MALVLNDRVRETSTSQGTGNITLAGAVQGFITFNSGIATSNTTYYTISEQGTANFEVGLGTLSASTTLQRTTVLSNSAGTTSKINFNSGGSSTLDVFCTLPATIANLPSPVEYGSSSAPELITVTVGTKTTAHPYSGQGSSNAYFLGGLESPAITFTGADASYKYYYRFDQSDSTNSGHPLLFYLEADKSTAYTTGVTTNGTPGSSGAYTQIAVDVNTPNVLYYQCSSHSLMGNFANTISNYANGNLTVGSQLRMPDNTAAKILVGDGTSYQEVAVSGDATLASNGALTVTGGVSAGFVVAMSIAL